MVGVLDKDLYLTLKPCNLSVNNQGLYITLSIYVNRFRILLLMLSKKKQKWKQHYHFFKVTQQLEIASIKNIYRTVNW